MIADPIRVPTALGPLSVARHGRGGPAALLWHSLFVDGKSWDLVLPSLSPGRTLLVVDGPCHGASPGPGRRFTLDECAQAAVAILDHFQLPAVDWIGNAWGGHVGVLVAVRAPERVRSLVAMSSPMQRLRPLERAKLAALASVFRVVGWKPFLLDAVCGALLKAPAAPGIWSSVAAVAQAPGPAATLHAIHSVALGRPSLLDQLSLVQARTLLVTSDHDPIWPPELARAQARLLPAGRLELLAGVGHLPALEAPEATGKLLLEWLGGNTP